MKYSFWSKLTITYTVQRIVSFGWKYGLREVGADFKDRETLYDHRMNGDSYAMKSIDDYISEKKFSVRLLWKCWRPFLDV